MGGVTRAKACGDLRFQDAELVELALDGGDYAVVLSVTLAADRRLAQQAEDAGAAYAHIPLRSGAFQIPQFRKAVSAVRAGLKLGDVLVVGETAGGPAAKVVAEATKGTR